MSKQLWNYLHSRVQVVNSGGKIINGLVTDFIDEMDNDEQDEITILIDNPSLMNQLRFLSLRVRLSQLKQSRRLRTIYSLSPIKTLWKRIFYGDIR